MRSRTRKALISGGAGFIGSHLCRRLLLEGFEVHLVDDMSRGVADATMVELCSHGALSWHRADLRDPHSIRELGDDYTHVFHFAALLGVQNVLDRPYAVLRDNVSMLETMLDFGGRQRRLERFVFPSTSEVYAGTLQYFDLPVPTPETTPLALSAVDHPRTSYMLSKIYGEALVHQAGLPFTIVRPHNFYGPRMGLSHVVPELLKRIHDSSDGDDLVVYSIDHRRTFCYIDDAIEFVVRLLATDVSRGETFNLGVEVPEVTIRELAELLVAVVGRAVNIVAGETTPGSPSRRCPSIAKVVAATGYSPGVSLDEGIRRTFDWYRSAVFESGGASAR